MGCGTARQAVSRFAIAREVIGTAVGVYEMAVVVTVAAAVREILILLPFTAFP